MREADVCCNAIALLVGLAREFSNAPSLILHPEGAALVVRDKLTDANYHLAIPATTFGSLTTSPFQSIRKIHHIPTSLRWPVSL